MKKGTKIGLGCLTLLLGSVLLTGCTASFCTLDDKAHMLYMMDPGVTVYTNESAAHEVNIGTEKEPNMITIEHYKLTIPGVEVADDVYYYVDVTSNTYLNKIKESVEKNAIRFPSDRYWHVLDSLVLQRAVKESKTTEIKSYLEITTARDKDEYLNENYGILDLYGYLKFSDDELEKRELWNNWNVLNDIIVKDALEGGTTYGVTVEEIPSNDFIVQYKKAMESNVSSYRSCLAVSEGYYGAYGTNHLPVKIEAKGWTDWKGLLEFLLVWPIGAFVDVLTSGMIGGGVANGVAQLLAILIVTFVVRGVMLLVTFKSTKTTAKMNELQPELQKIQAKYPNANTNTYEKQRLAMETQKLYKKHGVNPLGSLLVMIIQFPVFICVWGALQGSAWLSTGSFLGLQLSASISSVIFSSEGWQTGGAVTALILFILMAAAQVVAMLLPQWIQKKNAKKLQKLGRNPAQNQQANKMKWFTYIMLAMIIFMGFSLASAMGVYWFVGALFSIGQTLVIQAINNKKKNGAK